MERQNITFSLPKEVLKKGRILAAERRISLNELVRDLLQKASDYDAEGRLAGIEILDAVKRLGDPKVFKQVTLENIAIA